MITVKDTFGPPPIIKLMTRLRNYPKHKSNLLSKLLVLKSCPEIPFLFTRPWSCLVLSCLGFYAKSLSIIVKPLQASSRLRLSHMTYVCTMGIMKINGRDKTIQEKKQIGTKDSSIYPRQKCFVNALGTFLLKQLPVLTDCCFVKWCTSFQKKKKKKDY